MTDRADEADLESSGKLRPSGPTLAVRLLNSEAQLPTRANTGDAGLDLRACESVVIAPGGVRAMVATGVAIALEDGWAGFVQPRSGLAAKHGVTVLNSPGLIDAGYRGELRVVLVNTDPETSFSVEVGDRIAQLVVIAHVPAVPVEVEELPDSDRGAQGFGSSGR